MKHFWMGAAAALGALSISASAWAQSAAPTPAPVQSTNRMQTGGKATSERGATGSASRAHHRHHTTHSTGKTSANSAADQLNRQELSGLQGGNPTTMNRMPAGGRPTSGTPTH